MTFSVIIKTDNFADNFWKHMQVTASSVIDPTSTTKIQLGPLSGLTGSVIATTPQGKIYFRLKDVPGVTVLIPSHLLQQPVVIKQPN